MGLFRELLDHRCVPPDLVVSSWFFFFRQGFLCVFYYLAEVPLWWDGQVS